MTAAAYGVAFPASRGVLAPAKLLLERLSVAPTGAYAAFRLTSAYAGPCLRVRRSSDNAERDIGFSGSYLDVAALLAFVGAGDGYVTKLYDQSGNARDFSQAAAANQPQAVSAGSPVALAGGASLLFNGTGQYLAGPTQEQFFASAGFSTVGLSRPLAGGASTTQPFSGPQILSESSGWTYNGYGQPSAFTGGYWSGAFQGVTIPVTFPSTHVSCVTYSGVNGVKAWLDGGAAAAMPSATAFTVHTGAGMRLGASQSGYFNGTISAALAFDVTLGIADVNRIGQDWAAKGGAGWTTAA